MATFHTFMGPRRYVQGAGVLAEAGTLIRPLGVTALALYERAATNLWNQRVAPALGAAGIALHGVRLDSDGKGAEIARAAASARCMKPDMIIGLGSGTAIDAARAIASESRAALVVIPTALSGDAARSGRAARCIGDGGMDICHWHGRNPDLVLVDTQVLADGPVRAFIAGVGDALPTWFEARAAAQSYATTAAGGWQTVAAGALAKACWETLRRCAPEAVAAVRAHRVTDAVEKVVEAAMLLSGIGAESGGQAAARAIGNALAALPELRGRCSGELMGFALLAQLELEKHIEQDRRDVLAFCMSIGVPVCFADVGLPHVTAAQIAQVAARALAAGETIYHEPCALLPETVMEALRAADARGRAAKAVFAAA